MFLVVRVGSGSDWDCSRDGRKSQGMEEIQGNWLRSRWVGDGECWTFLRIEIPNEESICGLSCCT